MQEPYIRKMVTQILIFQAHRNDSGSGGALVDQWVLAKNN